MMNMLKKILVPIDGTEYSWRAMEYAASLAKLSGGHLVILTVVKPGIKAVGGAPLEEELVYSANGPVMQIGNEVLGAAKHLMDKQEIPCDRRHQCYIKRNFKNRLIFQTAFIHINDIKSIRNAGSDR
jgi:nucleotide-binding universal stress UspA family protein